MRVSAVKLFIYTSHNSCLPIDETTPVRFEVMIKIYDCLLLYIFVVCPVI